MSDTQASEHLDVDSEHQDHCSMILLVGERLAKNNNLLARYLKNSETHYYCATVCLDFSQGKDSQKRVIGPLTVYNVARKATIDQCRGLMRDLRLEPARSKPQKEVPMMLLKKNYPSMSESMCYFAHTQGMLFVETSGYINREVTTVMDRLCQETRLYWVTYNQNQGKDASSPPEAIPKAIPEGIPEAPLEDIPECAPLG